VVCAGRLSHGRHGRSCPAPGPWEYGEHFDEAALKALPEGSFYTEPANVVHFVEVKEPVIIQVKGTGPSGRTFVNSADNPK
jgi:hypothetical protein